MKILTSAILMLSLGACTAQVRSGTSPRHSPPPPPPPRGEPGPPPSRPAPPPVVVAPPAGEAWVELAAPQRNDDNRDFITVGAKFRRLRLDVSRGTVVLRQVVVEFGNGENQKVRVDRELGRGGDNSLMIDLEGRGRNIVRVLVYMDPAQRRGDRGVYRLFGM